MSWFRENRIKVKTLDVLNRLTIEGRPVYANGYPGAGYKGRDYFVNNIQGSSGNDGKSWNNAMDEFSTAVSAWETYRATLDSDDQHIRGRIFIQGTATAYSPVTALPLHCDVIGIGDDPRGNGKGIARIGADDNSGNGVVATSTVRGTNFYNLQFQAGNGYYAFKGTNFFRCRWDNCAFGTSGLATGAPAAGFSAAICSGNVWKDCHWINAAPQGSGNDIGFEITSTHFHNCLVENCYISGADAAVRLAYATINGYGSQFTNCFFGWGSETCAIGVDDRASTGHVIFRRCDSRATVDYDMFNNGAARVIACYAANALVTAS